MVVDPEYRGRGIARSITALAVREAVSRDAELLLVSTVSMRQVYLDLGFSNADPSQFRLVQEGKPERTEEFYARWHRPELEEVTLYSCF